jgi:hypothetical protein
MHPEPEDHGHHPWLPKNPIPPDANLIEHRPTADELWRGYVDQLKEPGRFADLVAQEQYLAPRLQGAVARLDIETGNLIAQGEDILDDPPAESLAPLRGPQPARAIEVLALLVPEILDDPKSDEARASFFYPEARTVLNLIDLTNAYRLRLNVLRQVIGEYVATGRAPVASSADPIKSFLDFAEEMPEYEWETARAYLEAVLTVKRAEERTGKRAKSSNAWCEKVAKASGRRHEQTDGPVTANAARNYFMGKGLLPANGIKAAFPECRANIEALAEKFFQTESD